jgi:hypothetical protein
MANLEKLYCLVRKSYVSATPEEVVRQQLVSHMIHNLSYPSSYLALEKELNQVPHLNLNDKEIPNRRADLICFGKDIHPQFPLYPLLLVECKAVRITSRTLNQVAGYNHFLGAYFIAVVNGQEIRTGWYDSETKEYKFVKNLPSYTQLLEILKNSAEKTAEVEEKTG